MDRIRLQRLKDDLDVRLLDAWSYVWSKPELADVDPETMGHALRIAYGQGWTDALEEVVKGVPGDLANRHGLGHPLRKAKGTAKRIPITEGDD